MIDLVHVPHTDFRLSRLVGVVRFGQGEFCVVVVN